MPLRKTSKAAGSRRVIRDIVDKIVAEYAPEKIILFGSQASGRADSESDIDLLIVKDTDMPPMERWVRVKRLLRDRNRLVSVSPIIYSPRELEARLAMGDFFLRDIMEQGEVLYG